MDTVSDIRDRAVSDLRRRIFQSTIFSYEDMIGMTEMLARQYAFSMPDEKLLAMARHDKWLGDGHSGNPDTQYRGGRMYRISRDLFEFLESRLRRRVDKFWEGRTSVELCVRRSRVELVGFFNKERPSRKRAANDSFEEMLHRSQQAPYA